MNPPRAVLLVIACPATALRHGIACAAGSGRQNTRTRRRSKRRDPDVALAIVDGEEEAVAVGGDVGTIGGIVQAHQEASRDGGIGQTSSPGFGVMSALMALRDSTAASAAVAWSSA